MSLIDSRPSLMLLEKGKEAHAEKKTTMRAKITLKM
jgi:hypothetical protein